ncbi:MAG: hypothetical protein WAW90_00715 [Minisyncoccia bacterium]
MANTNTTPIPIPPNDSSSGNYVRTFSNDMDTFQKGSTPGLVPFNKSKPAPSERLVGATPLAFVPITVPTAPVAPAHLPQRDFTKASPIETYSDALRKRVSETGASTATILAAEQDAAPRIPQTITDTSAVQGRNHWQIIVGVFLIVVSVAGIFVAYARHFSALAPIVATLDTPVAIFVDDREQVSGTGSALVQAINQSTTKPLSLNGVRLLSLDPAIVDKSVFSSLGSRVPDVVLRNVDHAHSMAGIVNVSSGKSPFFILTVESYGSTFSGMLAWEPFMQSDLRSLFPHYSALPIVSSSTLLKVATTTLASPKEGFHDDVVSNHDVRVYLDEAGRSLLLYGYWNQSTLVIARDALAFTEILRRLSTAHP